MSEQPIELLLVKTELPSKMLLHHVTPNRNNTHYLEEPASLFIVSGGNS